MKEFTLAENLTSYKCLNCGKSFNHKVSLNGHMNNHLGIKEFYLLTVESSLFFWVILSHMGIKHMEMRFVAIFVIKLP
jgi:hypothetical protein